VFRELVEPCAASDSPAKERSRTQRLLPLKERGRAARDHTVTAEYFVTMW